MDEIPFCSCTWCSLYGASELTAAAEKSEDDSCFVLSRPQFPGGFGQNLPEIREKILYQLSPQKIHRF